LEKAGPAAQSTLCRHRTLALVCRRWAALVNSPWLLEDIEFDPIRGPQAMPARLRHFGAWLVRRAAGHVRCLGLRVECTPDDDVPDPLPTLMPAVAACCTSSGAGTRLQELRVLLGIEYGDVDVGWAAALTSLTRLEVDAWGGCSVHLMCPLDHLTAMQDLALGKPLQLPAGG